MQDRKEVMKRWCGVMEWLDRLGYLTAGFSLLVLGMLIFAHAWYMFMTKAGVSRASAFRPQAVERPAAGDHFARAVSNCHPVLCRRKCSTWSPTWRLASSPAPDGCSRPVRSSPTSST